GCGADTDARDDGLARRVGRVRVEILPVDRALCARAARRPRRAANARAHPALARRLPAVGTRDAWLRRLPVLSPRADAGLGSKPLRAAIDLARAPGLLMAPGPRPNG